MAKKSLDLKRLAYLSKLRLSEEEEKSITPQLEEILTYVGSLSKLELSQEAMEAYIMAATNVLREDRVDSCVPSIKQQLIESFPEREGDILEVPEIFKEG